MSNGTGGLGGKWWYPIAVTVVGLVAAYFLFCNVCGKDGRDALALATKIHNYLGTNVGPSPSGLTGKIAEDNEFHRQQYDKIACEFYNIRHGNATGTPCPPGTGGGPSSRPDGPPAYP